MNRLLVETSIIKIMDIAHNIRKRRLELGISQDELAQKLGYQSRSSIAKIEKGQSDVPLSKLIPLASALDTTIENLLSDQSLSVAPNAIKSENERKNASNNRTKTAALILAGGKSRRNKQNIPNQFIDVLGKPVMIYGLEIYQQHPLIDDIFIVCATGWETTVKAYVDKYRLSKVCDLIPAGKSGLKSIHNGFRTITARGYTSREKIIIQESTRPFVTAEMISRLLAIAQKQGHAITCDTMSDKVQFLVNDKKTSYINREEVVDLQSPEAYVIDTLQEVFAKAQTQNQPLNDSCMSILMDKLGYHLNFCNGGPGNLKIIHQEDIAVFSALLKQKD